MLTCVSYVVCIWTVDPSRPTRDAVGRLGAQFGLVLDHRRGVAGVTVPATTGPRPLDGKNLWPALTATARGNITKKSPRTEVLHHVVNNYTSNQPATPTTSRRTPPSRQSSGLASTSGSLARATLGTLRFGCGRRQLQCTSHLTRGGYSVETKDGGMGYCCSPTLASSVLSEWRLPL